MHIYISGAGCAARVIDVRRLIFHCDQRLSVYVYGTFAEFPMKEVASLIFFNIQRHGDNTPEISCALCVCETGRRRDMRETVAGVLHNMRRAAIVLFWRVVLATIVGICKRHYIVRRHVFSVVDRDRLRASAIIWNCIVILIAVGCLMPR